MARTDQYTARQFIAAIPGTGGIITAIARKVGCSWDTAKKFIVNYPTVAQAYANECEVIGDLAETELFKAIKAGDLSAIRFYLATKGKGRGYTEKVETDGSLTLRVVYGEDGDE